jgi:hypothetical protein
LHIASALGAPGDTVGHIAFEVKVGAMGTTLGECIAADLANLASVTCLASSCIRLEAVLDHVGEVVGSAFQAREFQFAGSLRGRIIGSWAIGGSFARPRCDV